MSITTTGGSTWSVPLRTTSFAGEAQKTSQSSTVSQSTNQQPVDEYTPSQSATRESVATTEPLEESSANVQSSAQVAETPKGGAASVVKSSEETSSVDTTGKPAWISDEDWAEILENPNQKPSGMSDSDWDAYLQWAGKSTSSSSSSNAQPTVTTEDIVASERVTSTSKEIAAHTSSENANRYAMWNSESMNAERGTRIDVSA